LFGALLNGAACPFDLVDRGLAELATWLRREEISVYYSAPAVFREFAGSLRADEQFSSVRVLHLGGEPVVAGDFDQYKRHFSSRCTFINSLASNETGILTMYVGERSARFGDGGVPVGYQVDDKQILILDDEGRKQGANQLGQIAVRSRFLSPGLGTARDDGRCLSAGP
jgi:acyl-coenzyme A synthetase/AMP-(fatty) acid ligase